MPIIFLGGYEEFFLYAPKAENMDTLHFFDFLRNVGTFETMLIICCVIPYATSFCIDYNSSYIRLLKSRTGENNYIVSKVVSCGISGGLSIALGMLLFIGLVSLQYPLVDTAGGAYQSILMRVSYDGAKAFESFLLSDLYILYFALQIYLIFIVGAFWSVVGLTVSTLIPNPFVALFSPYILYFLQSIFIKNFPTYLNTINIIQGNYNIGSDIFNFTYATIFIIVLVLLLGIMFGYFAKRRLRDEYH